MGEGASNARAARWGVGLAAVAVAGGCGTILGVDRDYYEATDAGRPSALDGAPTDGPATGDGKTPTDGPRGDGPSDGPASTDGPAPPDAGGDGGCTSTGFRNGTLAASYSLGDEPWTNPNGALTAGDSSLASSSLSATSKNSDRLIVRGFGFGVPGGATITDVRVEITRAGSDHEDRRVHILRWTGTGAPTLGTVDRSSGGKWPTSLGTASYNGSPAAWGLALNGAGVSSSEFGVGLEAKFEGPSGSGAAQVDAIRVSVTYCP
jgi:hypothetical protein